MKFQRVDGALDDSLLDASREKNLLDAEGKTESGKIADFFRKVLEDHKMEVEAKSLASDTLPAFIIFDEKTRRLRDAMAIAGQNHTFPTQKTFVVNTNNPLIESLYKLQTSQPALAHDVAHHLLDLSLLAQKEIAPAAINSFIHRSTQVLEKLLAQQNLRTDAQ
jgi:molecular chaperone HtpG